MDEDKQKRTRPRLGSKEVDLEQFVQTINQVPDGYEGEIPIPSYERAEPEPPRPRVYRAGMHLEKQKFGDSKTTNIRQLLLSETKEYGEGLDEEEIGLDLTVSEDRALSAIQIMLSKTNYKGNLPDQPITIKDYKHLGRTPALLFSWREYYEAYGLSKGNRRQENEARKALEKLITQPRKMEYKRIRWETQGNRKKKVKDEMALVGPLLLKMADVTLSKGWEEGRETPKSRVTKLAVIVNPLFIDGIDDYFLLKDPNLHKELAAIAGKKRVSDVTVRFVNWLGTLHRSPWPISGEELIKKLRLQKMRKEGRKSRLNNLLQDSFRIAKEANYLTDYYQDEYGLWKFELNPERCSRLKLKKRPALEGRIGEEDSNLPE